jgi:uncharacterized protein YdhG (YjbR/CyaY superfamily)
MRSMLHAAALITAWFDTLEPAQRDTAQALRDSVLAAGPELAQSIRWGNLLFSHAGRHALAIVIHREHANLQVFNGIALAAQFPALEGTGRGMRHLKQRYRQPVDAARIAAIVSACVAEMA